MKWNISIYLSTYILILFGYVSGSPKKRKIDEQLKTYFENLSQNVFASAGQNVMLPCRVRHLNDKVVSWIRMRDLHILTSGSFLFTNDGRFGIHHPLKDSAIWNLEIKDVSQKDMGSYECQVNTEPKIKFLVNLTVFESDVMIGDMGEDSTTGNGKFEENNKNQEPSERRMTPGGSVSFTCVLNHFNQTRPSIQWNHNNESISIHGHKSSISIETERSLNNFISRLTLANVSKYDSGRYTCISGHLTSITFILHVILPENELALQDGLRSEASSIMNYFNLIVAIFLNTIITM